MSQKFSLIKAVKIARKNRRKNYHPSAAVLKYIDTLKLSKKQSMKLIALINECNAWIYYDGVWNGFSEAKQKLND